MTDEEKKYLLDIFRKACAYNGVRIISDLEEENAELKAQIKKMRNCRNCKYANVLSFEKPCNNCNKTWYTNYKGECQWEPAE